MKIDYLAFDLDGTLLDSKKVISKDTVDFLKKLKKKIIINSSRHYFEIIELIKELPLESIVYIISSEGQYIYNGKGKLIKTFPFLSIADLYTLNSRGYDEMVFFTDKYDYRFKKSKNRGVKKLRGLLNDLITVFCERNCKKKVVNSLVPLLFLRIEKIVLNNGFDNSFFINYNVVLSNITEITHKDVNKYLALNYLHKVGVINLDNVLYFGDGQNDLEVFKNVKNTVAMENAVPEVKENARFKTRSCDENGVLCFLKHFFITI